MGEEEAGLDLAPESRVAHACCGRLEGGGEADGVEVYLRRGGMLGLCVFEVGWGRGN